jgi:hypothetical protein
MFSGRYHYLPSAHGLSLISPRNYWSHCGKEPDDVHQVAQESDSLNRCEHNVTASSDQDLRQRYMPPMAIKFLL